MSKILYPRRSEDGICGENENLSYAALLSMGFMSYLVMLS